MSIVDDVLSLAGLRRVADSQPVADSGAAVERGATWNPWSGAAGGRKITDTRPGYPTWLSADEIDWLTINDGLCRRLIYGPVEDAIGRGWRTDADDDRDVTADLDARLDLESRLSEAMTSARQYGGAWLWLVTDDGAPLIEPLPEGQHDILAVQVVDQREARPYLWDDDPASGRFTRPSVVDITLRREDSTVAVGLVHTSRLVYIPGLPLSRSQLSPPERLGYDLSVAQAYWEALRDLLIAQGSAAGLVAEKSMPMLRLANKRSGQAADASAFQGAINAWARMRSSWGVTVLGEGDEFERHDANVSGVRDIVTAGYERVSAVEGIPLSALIGQAPAGLSSDDASGQRTYARFIGRLRRLIADRALRRVYEVQEGPARRDIVWPPVDPPTASDIATVNKARAEVSTLLVQMGAATAEDVREQFGGPEVLDVPALADDLLAPDEPPPDDDEEAVADAEDYAVPASARNNARMALRWREQHPDEIRGMTEVGWRRARQLATQARVGRDTVAAMAGFARHRASYEAARARDPDKPWTEAAIVAWLGWGGTSGVDWARRITGASED